MYRISFNPSSIMPGERITVYDPRDEGLGIRDATCMMAINDPGVLRFTVSPGHRVYDALGIASGHMELYDDSGLIFRGRTVSIERGFDGSTTIEAEGALAFLNDSVIPPFEFPDDFPQAASSSNVVRYLLDWIIAQHNDQVQPWQQLRVGNVTVRDSNNCVTRSSQKPATAMETLKSKLYDSSLGGYIVMRYSGGFTYVDYLAALPDSSMTVQFGANLLDLTQRFDGRQMYSAVWPVGANGLTLDGIPDGDIEPGVSKYGNAIINNALNVQIGIISRIMEWPQVTERANLLARAVEAVKAAGLPRSVDVSALDLSGSAEGFRAGTMVHVESAPHGLSVSYPLTQITIDLLDASQTQIQLGAPAETLTSVSVRGLGPRIEEA